MPIRVLAVGNVYPPHHLGGYEIIWQGAMRHLRDRGHQVRILTTDYRRPEVAADAIEDPDVFRELDWYWREHEWRALGLADRFALERRNALCFDSHLAAFSPDVITWWPVGGMSLGLLERARRTGIPAVLFVLDYWPNYGPRHDLWIRSWARLGPFRRLAERVTGLPTRVDFATAGRWVFCSRSARQVTVESGLQIDASEIITPGVDERYLSIAREPLARAWSWRLLYLGRVVEQKGVATAIESLSLLPVQASLRIVGEGDRSYRMMLERLAIRLGVSDRVQFEPPVAREQLIDVYRAADAVLFPVQWAEPWGLVPLEAMALGRPVVATGRGGSGDYLVDRGNALLFEPGNAAGLAAALQQLGGDAELRERLRDAGYETAAQHSEEGFNRRALEVIEETACGRR